MLYAILTVLPTSLKALDLFDRHPAKRLIINFHRMFSFAFWWPSLSHDGHSAWKLVHGSHMGMYHRMLQILAANFVKAVNEYNKSYPGLAFQVDKPNIHRVLELFQHTVPLFNHLVFICELVFESAHQPLKYFLSRNHTLGSHIYAVQLVLAKDWLVRLSCLWNIYSDINETTSDRHHAFMGLVMLLAGRNTLSVDWRIMEASSTLNDLREHIEHILTGTVENRFHKWYKDSQMTFSSHSSWVLQPLPKRHKFTSRQKIFLDECIKQLARLSLS